jgi:hypothetical protein
VKNQEMNNFPPSIGGRVIPLNVQPDGRWQMNNVARNNKAPSTVGVGVLEFRYVYAYAIFEQEKELNITVPK